MVVYKIIKWVQVTYWCAGRASFFQGGGVTIHDDRSLCYSTRTYTGGGDSFLCLIHSAPSPSSLRCFMCISRGILSSSLRDDDPRPCDQVVIFYLSLYVSLSVLSLWKIENKNVRDDGSDYDRLTGWISTSSIGERSFLLQVGKPEHTFYTWISWTKLIASSADITICACLQMSPWSICWSTRYWRVVILWRGFCEIRRIQVLLWWQHPKEREREVGICFTPFQLTTLWNRIKRKRNLLLFTLTGNNDWEKRLGKIIRAIAAL